MHQNTTFYLITVDVSATAAALLPLDRKMILPV